MNYTIKIALKQLPTSLQVQLSPSQSRRPRRGRAGRGVVNWERGLSNQLVGQMWVNFYIFLLYNFHAFTMKFNHQLPSISIKFHQVFQQLHSFFLVVKRLVETTNCFAKQFFFKGNPPALSQVEANPEPAKKTEVEAVAEGESTEKKEEATEKQDYLNCLLSSGIWSAVELWLYHVVTQLYAMKLGEHLGATSWGTAKHKIGLCTSSRMFASPHLLVMAQVCSTTIKLQVIQPSDELLWQPFSAWYYWGLGVSPFIHFPHLTSWITWVCTFSFGNTVKNSQFPLWFRFSECSNQV